MSEVLVSRLLARLDELERLAQAAADDTEPRWETSDMSDGVYTAEYGATFAVGPWGGGMPEVGPHIVAHDPHAVLRLCRAHRDIIDMYVKAKAQPVAESVPHSKGRGLDHASAMGRLTALGLVLQTITEGYGLTEKDPDD